MWYMAWTPVSGEYGRVGETLPSLLAPESDFVGEAGEAGRMDTVGRTVEDSVLHNHIARSHGSLMR